MTEFLLVLLSVRFVFHFDLFSDDADPPTLEQMEQAEMPTEQKQPSSKKDKKKKKKGKDDDDDL